MAKKPAKKELGKKDMKKTKGGAVSGNLQAGRPVLGAPPDPFKVQIVAPPPDPF